MNLWRLEWLRLWRTGRWAVLLGVHVVFGIVGPFTARYLDELLDRFGGGIRIDTPEMAPVDGIAQYVSNVSQLGLVAVVAVAAAALALDAKPESIAFLRTRVRTARDLVIPRVVTVWGVATVGLLLGTAIAWAFTAALLGGVAVVPMVVGTLYGAVYLAVVVTVVALFGSVTRSVIATVFASLAALIVLPLLALLPWLAPWLPSELLGAIIGLLSGEGAGDYLRSLVVSLVVVGVGLAVAVRRFDRREL